MSKPSESKKSRGKPQLEPRKDGAEDEIVADFLPLPGVTSLVAAQPPPAPYNELVPDQIEFYLRSAIHQDRTPGNLLIIFHPGRRYKFPRNLPDALTEKGYTVTQIDTEADRVRSVQKIRNALRDLGKKQAPLDVLVVSGDGTMDHHVLVAAFWAFYPDLVKFRKGAVDCSAVSREDLATIPDAYRAAFFERLPDGKTLEPSEATIKEIWLLRSRLEPLLLKQKPLSRILKRVRRKQDDLLLRIAILATLFPEKVVLRPHGFDLSALADATLKRTFQGLYPFVRSLCTYPAGTAADNAIFAGVPGWAYGLVAGLLAKSRFFEPLRRLLEKRLTRKFLRYFLNDSVVVPARISFVGFDGDWQRVSSHAAGGPGAGHFFSADLTSKTKSLAGYLKRIPKVIVQEGLFGSTIVRIRSRFASGAEKSFTEAQIAEALYTNRTFIAGVGSVPTTNPTSFAGQSSLLVLPPIWHRSMAGHRVLNLRSLATFIEAMFKGVLARILHMSRLGVGTLAGGGKFFFLLPEHQVAIKEGETIEIDYLTRENRPRAISIQVSGDPFQAFRIGIRPAWGPIPVLAKSNSLMLAATRRSLADLRLQQSYRLGRVYIGGVRYFRHHIGEEWSREFSKRTGLLQPPNHLPRSLPLAQRLLLDAWQANGAGEFVDTTESGLAALRRGRYAHNNDQSAHLLILKEPEGTLMVREVRAMGSSGGKIYETRSYYRSVYGSYIIYRSQTVVWHGNENPRVLQENHFFRSAEAFQQEAPTFFPVVARLPEEPTLLDRETVEEEPKPEGDQKAPDGEP